MYSQKSIQRFIKLRSRGRSLHSIAEQLRIPQSTLGDWNARYFLQISTARAANWERVEAAVQRIPERDLFRLLGLIERSENELARRNLMAMKDVDLIRLFSVARREYFRRRDRLMAPLERPRASSPPPPEPAPPMAEAADGQQHDPAVPPILIETRFPWSAPDRSNLNGFSHFPIETETQNRKKPDKNRTSTFDDPAPDIRSPNPYT